MLILTAKAWPDYELLDSGDGKRLERFGKYTLCRPDPQAIWKPYLPESVWQTASDGVFIPSRSPEQRGRWETKKTLPDKWLFKYQNLSFWVKLSPFKHTGVFPEQSAHWEWMVALINSRKQQTPSPSINILNLFGYTGASSLVCAQTGAKVTHVDASYPAIGWARENQQASGLVDKPIRWIEDDCLKFVEREIKREVKYDGIILDPPVFGHGPGGRVWKFNDNFPKLLENCRKILSDHPLFVIANAYAISSSALMLENVFKDFFSNLGGNIESGELALEETSAKRLLSTGIFARWHSLNKKLQFHY